jgi:dynein heavy chain
MEAAVADITERYRTLRMHGIEVARGEAAEAEALAATWQATVDAALTKDRRLVKVKDEFREVTRVDVHAFLSDTEALRRAFLNTGPASPGVTLAQGLQLLAEFRARLADANRRREALSNAERLFGLPLTRYPALGEIQEEIDRVAPLYDLYADQQAFAETNANVCVH